ncbi:MAG: Uma2 family endonuclease [Anaerolineae bacterium]|nr:Uma2 family endonuclease [Anaerolineae bacterium]
MGREQSGEMLPDTLLNPMVIIEVLSTSTKRYDRGDKFQLYKLVKTLQEYILIDQDELHIARYTRQPDQIWHYTEIIDREQVLSLRAIGCTLTGADVYRRVEFDERDDD